MAHAPTGTLREALSLLRDVQETCSALEHTLRLANQSQDPRIISAIKESSFLGSPCFYTEDFYLYCQSDLAEQEVRDTVIAYYEAQSLSAFFNPESIPAEVRVFEGENLKYRVQILPGGGSLESVRVTVIDCRHPPCSGYQHDGSSTYLAASERKPSGSSDAAFVLYTHPFYVINRCQAQPHMVQRIYDENQPVLFLFLLFWAAHRGGRSFG